MIAIISRFCQTLVRLIQICHPAQLPPTVLSPTESELAYQDGRSFFYRMELTGVPVQLLNTQYRM